MNSEVWKPIPGYEGRYEVSNRGRVRSKDWKDRLGRRVKGRVLSPNSNPKGYRFINLTHPIDGPVYKAVHRLVMLAFQGTSPLVVDHINENPSDNRLDNLRYVTLRENCCLARRGKKENNRVGWYKNKRGKYIAQYKIGTEVNYIGSFLTADEAADAYEEKVRNLEVYRG